MRWVGSGWVEFFIFWWVGLSWVRKLLKNFFFQSLFFLLHSSYNIRHNCTAYICFLIDFEVYFWIHNNSILDTHYISNHTSLVDTRMHNLLTFNFSGFNLFIESLLFIWTDMTTEIERSLRGNATLNTHLNVWNLLDYISNFECY